MIIKFGTDWMVSRNPSNVRAEAWTYSENSTLETLAEEVGLDKDEANEWLKDRDCWPVNVNSLVLGEEYTVPNVWITANLMQDGDVDNRGYFGCCCTVCRNAEDHKPNGVREVIVTRMDALLGKIAEHSGNIYGFVLYAHANDSGFIYNSSNYSYDNLETIHTSEILGTLSKNRYKIAYAYPMPYYKTQASLSKNKRKKSAVVNWRDKWKTKAVLVEGHGDMSPLEADI